eukprot:1159302-Pelagomonas_calceolata.AAC.15
MQLECGLLHLLSLHSAALQGLSQQTCAKPGLDIAQGQLQVYTGHGHLRRKAKKASHHLNSSDLSALGGHPCPIMAFYIARNYDWTHCPAAHLLPQP